MSDDRTPEGNPFIAGLLNNEHEPDDLPIAMPDGVISFLGSAWSGSYEMYPIVDMKVALDGEAITALLSIDMAKDVLAALTKAVAAAEHAAGEPLEQTKTEE